MIEKGVPFVIETAPLGRERSTARPVATAAGPFDLLRFHSQLAACLGSFPQDGQEVTADLEVLSAMT